jgi:ribosome-binding protein aMBF1 (putative translation factor)
MNSADAADLFSLLDELSAVDHSAEEAAARDAARQTAETDAANLEAHLLREDYREVVNAVRRRNPDWRALSDRELARLISATRIARHLHDSRTPMGLVAMIRG